ncbi:hypothetical protein TIFTF001_015550 [Ficus carica]|uniref:Uncharacterized protein n=1 Tax=Ficus carica TaxID=3494 RepID=A0AA88A1F1_FICCA|nr:hypothetical protein TIFTF001_015550 [Ficus carica]
MLECDFVLQTSGYYGLIRSTEEELEANLGVRSLRRRWKEARVVAHFCVYGKKPSRLAGNDKKVGDQSKSKTKESATKCPAYRGEGWLM